MIELCGVASRLRDWSKMPMCLAGATFILTSAASAEDYGRPTAILVSPIHEAQVVRGDDGMDHVEYELLVVSVFPEPVTLSSVIVLDPGGKELMRMDGAALAAADPLVILQPQHLRWRQECRVHGDDRFRLPA